MKNNNVTKNPLELKTSKFQPLEILHSQNGFVIARGIWKDKPKGLFNTGGSIGLACRWHDPEGLGYPNGFGNPQWFNLPGNVKDSIISEGEYGELYVTKTLNMEFISHKPSVYVVPAEEALNELLKYGAKYDLLYVDTLGAMRNRLPHSHHFTTKDDTDSLEVLLFRPFSFCDIPFFVPFIIEADDDDEDSHSTVNFGYGNSTSKTELAYQERINYIVYEWELELIGKSLDDFRKPSNVVVINE